MFKRELSYYLQEAFHTLSKNARSVGYCIKDLVANMDNLPQEVKEMVELVLSKVPEEQFTIEPISSKESVSEVNEALELNVALLAALRAVLVVLGAESPEPVCFNEVCLAPELFIQFALGNPLVFDNNTEAEAYIVYRQVINGNIVQELKTLAVKDTAEELVEWLNDHLTQDPDGVASKALGWDTNILEMVIPTINPTTWPSQLQTKGD